MGEQELDMLPPEGGTNQRCYLEARSACIHFCFFWNAGSNGVTWGRAVSVIGGRGEVRETDQDTERKQLARELNHRERRGQAWSEPERKQVGRTSTGKGGGEV